MSQDERSTPPAGGSDPLIEGLLKGEWGRLLDRNTEYLEQLGDYINAELVRRERATDVE